MLAAFWCVAVATTAAAQPNAAAAGIENAAADPDEKALLDKSLAELLSVEVVSASRQRVALGDTGAAVFVITQEDIVRSGARVLPEVLRLAPGVDVARISSGRWAVGVRGDTSRFSGGLQVLLDGRSIYSPYFSGVFWDVEQVPLADIERIEIVRGPAGAIWGPNAVNGVINIITFSARDTPGTRLEGLAGSDGQRWVHLRQGGATNRAAPNEGAWRLSGRASETSSYQTADGRDGRDARDRNRNVNLTGRLDQRVPQGDLSLQFQALQSGDRDEWLLRSDRLPVFNEPTSVRLKFRRLMASGVLNQRLADQSQLQVTASVARELAELSDFLNTQHTTADVQAQHQFSLQDGTHALTYGGGLRGFSDHTEGGSYGELLPADRQWLDWRLFAHDRITLAPNRLWLTAGLLLDHNRYTGVQPQPSIDLSWRISPAQSLWGSFSQSSRVPGRAFQDAQFSVFSVPVQLPGTGEVVPVPVTTRSLQAVSTKVTALQLGSRWRFDERLSIDLTGFVQQYRNLARFEVPDVSAATQAAVAHALGTQMPVYIDWVGTSARTSGVEVATDWRIRPGLRSQIALSTLRVQSAERPDLEASTLARSPKLLASWRLSWDLAPRVYLDSWLRYSGSRSSYLPGETGVPARTSLDLALRWRATPRVTLSVAGYNLGASRRVEASSANGFTLTTPVLIEPAVAVRASVRF